MVIFKSAVLKINKVILCGHDRFSFADVVVFTVAVVYRRAGSDNIHTVIVKAEMPGTVTITTGSGGDDVLTGAGGEDVPDLEGA